MATPTEKKTMTWTGEADQQLLLAVLAVHEVKIDYELVAEKLGCTPRAVQERMKKLKKEAKASTDSTAPKSKDPKRVKNYVTEADNQTPRKRGTRAKKGPAIKKTPTKKNKKGKEGTAFEVYDEEEAVKNTAAVDNDNDDMLPSTQLSKKRKRGEVEDDDEDEPSPAEVELGLTDYDDDAILSAV